MKLCAFIFPILLVGCATSAGRIPISKTFEVEDWATVGLQEMTNGIARLVGPQVTDCGVVRTLGMNRRAIRKARQAVSECARSTAGHNVPFTFGYHYSDGVDSSLFMAAVRTLDGRLILVQYEDAMSTLPSSPELRVFICQELIFSRENDEAFFTMDKCEHDESLVNEIFSAQN